MRIINESFNDYFFYRQLKISKENIFMRLLPWEYFFKFLYKTNVITKN